jgi:hypothetical protein
MFFKVHRLEFVKAVPQDTRGEFHMLIPVAGKGIRIRPKKRPDLATCLPFSCMVLVPAAVGPYEIEPSGAGPCQVVKVLMA